MIEDLDRNQLAEWRESAVQFARKGGDTTLGYFKKTFDLEYKNDRSPVTTADREAEEMIRELIEQKYPDHGIIGEEFGREGEERDVVWVIDPIDGTQSFIHGVPFYTTLIGVLVEGHPVAGVIYAPALDEMMSAAIGQGVKLNGENCRSRACNDIAGATFLTTDVENICAHGFERPWRDLRTKTRLHRTWGDAYGHLMVAAGRADLMFDPVLSIWDAAALLPIVTESGARFTDVRGRETIETGNALSMARGIADEVLGIFGTSSTE